MTLDFLISLYLVASVSSTDKWENKAHWQQQIGHFLSSSLWKNQEDSVHTHSFLSVPKWTLSLRKRKVKAKSEIGKIDFSMIFVEFSYTVLRIEVHQNKNQSKDKQQFWRGLELEDGTFISGCNTGQWQPP